MKNKIIIFMILFLPIAIFAYMQSSAGSYNATEFDTGEMLSKVDSKGKLVKFSSPMCSECKEVSKTVSRVLPDYETVILEEINVTDGSEKSDAMVEMYKVSVVPTMIFIDKGGNIVKKTEGAISEQETRQNLDRIK